MPNNVRHRGPLVPHQPPENAAAAVGVQNNEMNIVLLGKTGVGKSSAANTILGENRFTCRRSLSSVTNESTAESKVIAGTNISVIDTPGFFGNTVSKEKLAREFARSVYLSAAGVHAFLFVVPYGRITEQEEEILNRVKKVFGVNVLKHVIILFTYGDECDLETVESEIDQNEVVKRVIQRCQGYHIFNNRNLNDRQQVTDLLQKIDTMNVNGYYTDEMYKWAQKNTFQQFWYYFKQFFIAVVEYLWGIINSFSREWFQQTRFAYGPV